MEGNRPGKECSGQSKYKDVKLLSTSHCTNKHDHNLNALGITQVLIY